MEKIKTFLFSSVDSDLPFHQQLHWSALASSLLGQGGCHSTAVSLIHNGSRDRGSSHTAPEAPSTWPLGGGVWAAWETRFSFQPELQCPGLKRTHQIKCTLVWKQTQKLVWMGLDRAFTQEGFSARPRSRCYWVSVNAAHVAQQPEEMAGAFLRTDGFIPCVSTNLLAVAGFVCGGGHSSSSGMCAEPCFSCRGKKKREKKALSVVHAPVHSSSACHDRAVAAYSCPSTAALTGWNRAEQPSLPRARSC